MATKAVRRVSDAQLNKILNQLKPLLPEGSIGALFIFQDAGMMTPGSKVHALSTDYVTNGRTRDVADALSTWCRLVRRGDIQPRRVPVPNDGGQR